MGWQDDAACLGRPVDWFLAEEGSRKGEMPPIQRRALALCAVCPVADECLAWVLLNEKVELVVRGTSAPPWAPPGHDANTERVYHYQEGVVAGTTFEDRKATRHMNPEERLPVLKAMSDERARKLGLIMEGAV